ncbi:hypothetical protein IAR55_002315 [Kwoniella newhampshirensis]|uniref:Uncharacterized protein n=1 Tax=Kwoniella newhampshirensis TaxID=1651941 RepID=A0AAW0YT97_9TREE
MAVPVKQGFYADSDDELDSGSDTEFRPPVFAPALAPPTAPSITSSAALRLPPTAQPNKLFTPEELAVLPSGMLDRQKMKQQAKKAKKRQAAVARTEGELMLGFMDMGMEEPEAQVEEIPMNQSMTKKSRKEKRKENKKKMVPSRQEREKAMEVEMDEEEKKEKDFANFLATIGADDSDEEL